MTQWLCLIVGSALGGAARYSLAGTIYRLFGGSFPFGTLVVNLIGCFLVGLIVSLSEQKFSLGPHAKLLLVAGFCGAFTTFSAVIFETSHLINSGESFHAFANIMLSVALGFLLFRLGVFSSQVFS